MPRDFRHSALRAADPIRPEEVKAFRARRIFNQWVSGMGYGELAARHGMAVEGVRTVLRQELVTMRQAWAKWKLAEARCKALAMELRLLRLGREAPPDQPIEAIDPPAMWLKAFHAAGIETVNQLRAVEAEVLLANWRFPREALGWAILKLDRLGLSHGLKIPRAQCTAFMRRRPKR
jgi:hypothetical protein